MVREAVLVGEECDSKAVGAAEEAQAAGGWEVERMQLAPGVSSRLDCSELRDLTLRCFTGALGCPSRSSQATFRWQVQPERAGLMRLVTTDLWLAPALSEPVDPGPTELQAKKLVLHILHLGPPMRVHAREFPGCAPLHRVRPWLRLGYIFR